MQSKSFVMAVLRPNIEVEKGDGPIVIFQPESENGLIMIAA